MPPDMHNVRSNHVDEREASQVGEGWVRRVINDMEKERGVEGVTPELRQSTTQNLDQASHQRSNLRRKLVR